MLDESLVQAPGSPPKLSSTFEVVSRSPLALAMTTTNHTDQSILKTKAIVRLDGNTMIYCVGAPGQPRPDRFATTSDDANTLVVLRRRTQPTEFELAWQAGRSGDFQPLRRTSSPRLEAAATTQFQDPREIE